MGVGGQLHAPAVWPLGITQYPQQETGENRIMKSLVICHSQPNIVRVVKSRGVRGWGVVRRTEMNIAAWWGRGKEREHMGRNRRRW